MLLLMAVDDGCEDAGQVAVSFDFVELAGLNERREHCPVLGTCIVTGEERVLSLQGNRTDCALNGVAVHLDATIAKKEAQPIPVFGDVFEGFACWRFGSGPVTV